MWAKTIVGRVFAVGEPNQHGRRSHIQVHWVSRFLLCAKAYNRLLGNLFQGYDIIPVNPV